MNVKNILITLSIIIVSILLIFSLFFDFNLSSDNEENDDELIRDYSGTENNEIEVSEETEDNSNDNNENENNEADVNGNDNDTNNDVLNDDEIKKQSKEIATNFVKEFHSLDETLDNPTQHIENAQEYIEDDFYDFLLNDYPVNIDGADKQTWDKVSAQEFGKSENNRIWDINVKGELKNDDGKEDLDMQYVVQVTEKNNGDNISVTNFWVDPIIPRDENGIDIYEGKKDMGEDNSSEDLTEAEETELLIGILEQRQGEMINE